MQKSLKSLYLHEIKLEQLETTEYTYYDNDTKRRKILKSEILWWGRNQPCITCWAKKWWRWINCMPCYQKVRRSTYLIKCDCCWKDTERKLVDIRKAIKKWQTTMYCTQKCWWAVYMKKYWYPCKYCWGTRSSVNQKYCSEKCRNDAMIARRKIIQCINCWIDTYPLSHLTRFCCMDCKNSHHSKNMLWKLNPNYKHWLALDNYPNAFYKARKTIIWRDWWACVICWTNENLAVHHKDNNPLNNDYNNLITELKQKYCYE